MKLNNKGFSLVELMVVVAIIGILASVAVPSVNKYMAKSRQSEAKTNLGSLYTAEKAFFAEFSAYHAAFPAVGFSPEGRLRYNMGFGAVGVNATAANGYTGGVAAAAGNIAAIAYCGADGAMVNNCTLLRDADGNVPPALAAGNTTAAGGFTAEATTVIVAGAPADQWTIDQIKQLTQTVNGIP